MSSTAVSCFGGNNGTATATVTGGTAPYTYVWFNNAQTTSTITGLTAGTYTVTVSDANNCTATASVIVAQPSEVVVTTTVVPATCGLTNGSATASATGGTPGYTYVWSNNQTGATATNLAAGNYTVTVTDLNGCTKTAVVTILQLGSPSVAMSSTAVSCFGGNNGTATATVTGGTAPYTYVWFNNAQTTSTITGLTAGTYTVTVSDANNCTATASVIVAQPSEVVVTTTVVPATCGLTNGSATASATGGTPSYTYAWSNNQTGATATNLAAGTYTVTVTDLNGCTKTAVVTIQQLGSPSVAMSSTAVSCFGGNDGTATATVTGGTAPYTYTWFGNPQTTSTITGLTAGTYTVTVSDANNCTATAIVIVAQPSAVVVTTTVVPATCGATNGSATASATGGTPGYTYVWSNNQTGATATNLAAGTYTVTVTDANGCTKTAVVTILQLGSPSVAMTSTAVKCFGGNDGTATATVTGGTAPYTYVWAGSTQITSTITGLTAGTYTVTVSDANNCTATASVTVAQPSEIVITVTSNPSTCGAANGSASASATGGTPSYTYFWSNNQSGATQTGLLAGTYTVTVTDGNNCTKTAVVTVNNLGAPVVTITPTNVTCFGGNNGTASANVNGGTAPYTYVWSGQPVQNTQTAVGLFAGTYTVTVSDANGCTGTASVTITQGSQITHNFTVNNVLCNGTATGSIDLTVSGGNPPVTFQWSNGATTEDVSNLLAGVYTVTTTDASGCTKATSILVNEPPALIVAVVNQTNVTCFGGNNGAIDITVSGGTLPYTYTWSPNGITQNLSGLSAGTYTVTVTDGNSCTKVLTVTITSPTAITPVIVATPTNCGGSDGAINVTVSGGTPGYTYDWAHLAGTNNPEDLSGLGAGTYTVTITDAAGCTTVTSATVANDNSSCTPSVNIVKFVNNQDANTAPGAIIIVPPSNPPTVTFTYVVTNTGNLTLTNLVVTDNKIPGTICTIPSLAPGASATCTATQTAILGLYTNIGTVSGQPVNNGGQPFGPPVTDTDPANYTGIFINIDKMADKTQICPGEEVTYMLITRMLGGAPGLQIRNVMAMDNNVPGTFTCNSQYWVGCNATGGVNCDINGNCILDFNDLDGDGTSEEEFKWQYTMTLTQTTVNIAEDMGEVWYVDPTTGQEFFIDNVGNSDQVTVTVNPNLCASIGDYVWSDTNGDGQQGGTENGISGVTVNLYTDDNNDGQPDTPGAPIATTTTNGTGLYQFTGLVPGNYIVGFVTPLTYTPSPVNIGDDATDSDANPVTGYTGTIVLTQGESDQTNDAGFIPPSGSIGNFVWNDLNGDGIQDPGEPGIPNVVVTLFSDPDGDGNYTTVVTSTTTNGSGIYVFPNLPAGNYVVGFTTPNGYTSTPSNQSGNDEEDSDNVGGTTGVIVLPQGQNNMSVDAGFYIPASIGNFVWNDLNQNGLQNGEPGISGVSVSLYADSDGDGQPDNPAQPLATQLTGSNGQYNFGGLAPGNYVVGFVTPTGYQPTTENAGNDTQDSDADPVTGYTGTINLVSGEADDTNDAGFIQLSSVSNFVWEDLNGNGVQDPGEPGIPGVTVNLISGGSVIATTTTDNNGEYAFTGLLPGPYQVGFELPTGYSFTVNTGGVSNPTNSDANANTGETAVFTLQPGENNTNVDAGMTQEAGLGNYVWEDLNGNGLQDGNEPGIEGVTVTLYQNNTPIATTTTDNNGFYQFTGLTPGNYVVGFSDPVGNWNNSPQDVNNNNSDALDSDANASTGLTGTIVLPSGTTNQTIDAGFIRICNLAASGVVSNASCGQNNGAINVTVTGAYQGVTFQWSNQATTEDLEDLTAGAYTVTITDENGCSVIRTFSVSQTGSPTVALGQVNQISCFGLNNGSIDINVSGGLAPYQYNWSNGATTQDVNNLAPGTYCVTVTDAAGCNAVICGTITQPNLLVVTAVATQATCGLNNGKVTTTVIGGTPNYTYQWSGGQGTAANLNNVGAGTYTVTVTDSKGCTATASATVIQTGKPTIAAAGQGTIITKVSCNGGSDGAITILVTGGTQPYTYNWSTGGASTPTRTNLIAGTYTVTVTDNLGCTDVRSFIVGQPAPFNFTVTTTPADCGEADGTITPIVTGGTPPYSYVWNDGFTDPIRSGLTMGTYTATITDAKGCTGSFSATVGGSSELVVTWNVTHATCGQCNGKIVLNVSGATGPYWYDWFDIPGLNPRDRENLCPGTYAVWVYSSDGCKKKVIISVNTTSGPTVTPTVTQASCGQSNGSINLSVNGGTAPYTYVWSNNATTSTLNNLAAGTYTVTVKDATNCTTVSTSVVANGAAPVVTPQATATKCGLNNGSVILSVTGGVAPFTFDWAHVAGSNNAQNLNGLAAGTYCVTVSDAAGCTSTACVTVNGSTAITATAAALNTTCGQTNGQVTTSINGGLAPYTYVWSNGSTTATLNNVGAGNYCVTITDAALCTATACANVGTSGGATLVASSTPARCGLSNGTATVNATGGTAPYLYVWSNNLGTTATVNNLAAGTYTVTVTDASGCSGTASVAVSGQPAVVIALQATNTTCGLNNGGVTVSVSSGVAPYTYLWNTNATTATINNQTSGVYTVTVTDANLCTKTATATVGASSAVTATIAATPAACGMNNGTVTVSANGGVSPYTYNWNIGGGSTPTRNNLMAGTYTVTVSDAVGCTAVVSASVGTLNGPSVVVSSTPAGCGVNNGTATATVTGGALPYTFNWSNGGTTATISSLGAGQYCVTVTDANNCSATACVTVSGSNAPTVVMSGTPTTCGANNGTATATVSGGNVTYIWSNNATTSTINNLAAGTYTVTVTPVSGSTCTATATFTVGASSAVTATTTVTNLGCNSTAPTGAVTINVTSGTAPYTYQWANGATTQSITNLAAGTYCATVTDASGCTTTVCGTVNEGVMNIDGVVNSILCAGSGNGSINITVTGGNGTLTYDWAHIPGTNDVEDLNNLSGGTYSVTVSDANGCTVAATYTVNEPGLLYTNLNITPATCVQNDGIILAVTNGGVAPFTYDWAHIPGPNDVITEIYDATPGTYTVTVTDANGCSYVATGTVTAPVLPTLAITNVVNPTCTAPNSGQLTATSNGISYVWSNQATTATITGLAAGTYTVTVTGVNGCTVTASATLTNPNGVTVAAATQVNPSCVNPLGGSITLNVSTGTAPFNFDWSHIADTNNPQNLSGLAAGTYVVTVSDANGCSSVLSVTLTTPNAPSVSVANVTNVLCNGASTGSINITVLNGTAPYTYAWSNQATTANINGLAAGTYTVTVTDAVGCTHSTTATVTQPAAIVASGVVKNVDCNGNATGAVFVTISGGTAPFNYNWAHIQGSVDPANISGLVAGSYFLTITDSKGCTKVEVFTVTQPNELAAQDVTTGTTCNTLTGSIIINPIGGTAPYTYDWAHITGNDNPKDLQGLDAGTYYLTVTDANGCTFTKSMVVTIVPTFTVGVVSIPSNCVGPTGGIDLTVSGTLAPFTYDWADVPGTNNTPDRTNVAAGTYTVTVSDATGCTTVVEAVVTQPEIIVNVQTENTVCGQTNGEIDLTVSGGTAPYTYDWANVAGTNNPSDLFNLAAGTYIVTVTDSKQCTAVVEVNITQVGGPQLTTAVTAVSCNGTATGSIDLSVNGGVAPYTYNWLHLNATNEPQDLTNLVAGTYAVTVTDASGCQIVTAVTVTQPLAVTPVLNSQNVSCGNISDGSIDLSVSGGTAPYTYNWSHITTGSEPQDVSGLSAGFYTVTVTDANGCTGVATGAIQNPPTGITIGSYVWHDADQDGEQDDTEIGTPGITVRLIKAGVDGSYGTGDDVIVATTVTNASGLYQFGCVTAGTYAVQFSGIPTAHEWTTPNAGQNNCKDSDVSEAGISAPFTVTTALVNIPCLDAGHHIACHNVLHPGIIAADQTICSGQTPALIYEVQAPTGGSGNIEYQWMTLEVTPNGTQWVAIPNTNSPVYQPGALTQTAYFMRCVRREGCTTFLETNVVTITVLKPGVGNCEEFKPDFTVTKMGEDDAMIDWTTLPEMTQYLYVVQYSVDQQGWKDIANVIGHGNSAAPNWYNQIHYDPICGRNYYRIMRMDAYGNEALSEVKYVDIDLAADLDAIQFFPNPTSDYITISRVSTCGMAEDATITLFAANGDLLREEVVSRETVGSRTIDISQLPPAVYLVRVRLSNGSTKTVRVTKI